MLYKNLGLKWVIPSKLGISVVFSSGENINGRTSGRHDIGRHGTSILQIHVYGFGSG